MPDHKRSASALDAERKWSIVADYAKSVFLSMASMTVAAPSSVFFVVTLIFILAFRSEALQTLPSQVIFVSVETE